MYDKVNPTGDLIAAAEKFTIDNDRSLYIPYFKAVEEYCAANMVLLGGQVGVDILLSRPYHRGSFMWELYTDNALTKSREIADILYKTPNHHIDSKTVVMDTVLKYKEFTIKVNNRLLFTVYGLDKYRGISLVDLVGPVPIKSYFSGTEIKCMSSEIQLIEIYRSLYLPARRETWDFCFRAEAGLMEGIKGSHECMNIDDEEVDGGCDAENCIVGGADNITKLNNIILTSMCAESDYVVIGDYALLGLDKARTTAPIDISNVNGRLQILADSHIDEVINEISAALDTHLSKSNNLNRLSYVKYPLNIPTDFQLTKYTVYYNDNPLMDVFNSTTYEMIPYKVSYGPLKNVKLGNVFVVLRFKMIDLWILKLIMNLGSDPAAHMAAKIDAVWRQIRQLRGVMESVKPEEYVGGLFQLKDYVGRYINEIVAKRKIARSTGERFKSYIPAAGKK